MARTSVKESVFRLLSEQQGTCFSGEALADSLGVSRAAVWKAVTSLREEGYPIVGTNNRGYALDADYDLLSLGDVMAALSLPAAEFYLPELFPIIDSTNTALIAAARAGASEGTVYIAEEQTAGKGRMGRSFYSPRGTGVYISILLRPTFPASEAVIITAMAAVAGARAAERVRAHFGLADQSVQIKWVNDLFLRGKKIAGILTEADYNIETGGLSHAVLGIGFDLCPPEGGWPEEISAVAGSLFEERTPKGARALTAAFFLEEFLALYRTLPSRKFVEDYRRRQMVLGRTVEVLQGSKVLYAAMAVDVNDNCGLVVVRDEDEQPVILDSGEVRIRL